MSSVSIAERLDQIDRIASRALAIVTVLVQYFCISDRPSELDDAHLIEVLEHVEEALTQISEHSHLPDPVALARGPDA